MCACGVGLVFASSFLSLVLGNINMYAYTQKKKKILLYSRGVDDVSLFWGSHTVQISGAGYIRETVTI